MPAAGPLVVDASFGAWTRRGIGLGTGLIIVAAFVVAFATALNVVIIVFMTILFASALGPVVDAVRTRAPFGRTAATGLLFLLAGVAILGLAVLIVTTALSQAGEIGARIPELLRSAKNSADTLPAGPARTVAHSLLDEVTSVLDAGGSVSPEQIIGAGSTAAEAFGAFTTVATLLFFWLHERARLQRFALAFIPLDRRGGTREAWNDIEDRLGRWVRAQLFLMALMGVATGIAYTVLGLPGALAVALAAAFLEAIPIVGPLLGAIPALIVAATVRPDLLLPVVVVYAVIQLAESNFVVPVVMGNSVGLSPFIVLVAVLFGAALGGVIGAFLAVPIAASAEIVLERLQARETPVSLETSPSAPEP